MIVLRYVAEGVGCLRYLGQRLLERCEADQGE